MTSGPTPVANATGRVDVSERARALVLEHFNFVWRLLRRCGVPEADVDDAAQQVFIVVVQRLPGIPKERERSFLYGASLRVGTTVRRNQRRRARWVTAVPAEGIAKERDPAQELERRQAMAWLDELLGALPEEVCEVFVLCELEGITALEAARLIGVPPGTVASRLRRAREIFRRRLQRLQAEEAR